MSSTMFAGDGSKLTRWMGSWTRCLEMVNQSVIASEVHDNAGLGHVDKDDEWK
jgi:hypothetical protein